MRGRRTVNSEPSPGALVTLMTPPEISSTRRTFSRAQLMDEFWDGETSASLRAVDVYITRIRDKMSVSDDFKIMTVHGLGYKAVPNT